MGKHPIGTPAATLVATIFQFLEDFWWVVLLVLLGIGCLCLLILRIRGLL